MAKKPNEEIIEQPAVDAVESVEPVAAPPQMRKYQESMKSRYPDEYDPASNEPDMLDKYSTDLETEVGRYKESEMTLQEIITAYPEFAQMLFDIVVSKVPPNVAIAKHFSQEDLIVPEGAEDYEGYQAALKERTEKAERKSALDKEIEANQDATIAAIDSFCESKGYDDAAKDKLLDFINDTFQEMLMKKVTEPILIAFDKALNHDSNIAEAEQVGELRGKNANIELKKAKDSSVKAGDGVPMFGKGNGEADVPEVRKNKLFGDIKERKGI